MPEKSEVKFSKFIGIEALCLLLIPLFFAAVWIPVYQTTAGNVLMQGSIFFLLWDFLQEGLIYLFYWLSVAFLGASLLLFGWKKSLPFLGFYLLGAAIRSIGTVIASAIVLRSFDDVFKANLADASLEILYDFLLLAAFCLIFYLVAMRNRGPEARKALLPTTAGPVPMPMHLSVLLCLAVYFGVRMYGRIRYDIFLGAATGTQDIVWMVFYYVADLVLLIFGHFAVLLILKLITKKK